MLQICHLLTGQNDLRRIHRIAQVRLRLAAHDRHSGKRLGQQIAKDNLADRQAGFGRQPLDAFKPPQILVQWIRSAESLLDRIPPAGGQLLEETAGSLCRFPAPYCGDRGGCP